MLLETIEAVVEFKYTLLHLEQNTQQWRVFHLLPSQKMVTSIEAENSFLTECLKNGVAKKTKRSWTYMRDNGVDLPYLFLHHGL